MDWRTSTLSGAGRTHDESYFYAGELDAIWRFYIFYLPPLAANHIGLGEQGLVPYPSLLSTLTNLLIPQCWPGHSGKMYTHTAPWPLEIGHVSIKHIWINHPRGASPLELSSMWPLPIHFTAALCGNQAWIIKVSSEQWSIHWGPCSQTARSYFSGNDIEITWVCFQTMHINVKYVRPNMSIIITVQAEAVSRLILQKCCEMMWGEQVSTAPAHTKVFFRGKEWEKFKGWYEISVVHHRHLYVKSFGINVGNKYKCIHWTDERNCWRFAEGIGQKKSQFKLKRSFSLTQKSQRG